MEVHSGSGFWQFLKKGAAGGLHASSCLGDAGVGGEDVGERRGQRVKDKK